MVFVGSNRMSHLVDSVADSTETFGERRSIAESNGSLDVTGRSRESGGIGRRAGFRIQ